MKCNCVNIYGKSLNLYEDEIQALQDMTNNHLAQDCEAGLGYHIVQKVYNRCPLGCTNSKNKEYKKLFINEKVAEEYNIYSRHQDIYECRDGLSLIGYHLSSKNY